MFNKLINLLSTYPRLGIILILSICVLALLVFLAVLKGVALIIIVLTIVGITHILTKPFRKT